MGEFEETKKAIGVGGMDDRQRKEMFDKFRSAGGEVVKDKAKQEEEENQKKKSRSKKSSNSSSTSRSSRRSTSRSSSGKESEAGQTYAGTAAGQKSREEMEAQMGNFFNRLIVRFKCWAGRVTPFNSAELFPEFVSEINLEVRSALMELRMAGIDILTTSKISKEIAKQMDAVNPAFIEVIGIGQKMYDGDELSQISDGYRSSSNAPVPLSKAAPAIYSLFKKLYYLYPYQGTYKKGIQLGYDLLQKHEKKPAVIYNSKKKKAQAAITTLFDKFFPRLHLAILRHEAKNIPMISFFMEELLEVSQEEKPGKRKTGDPLPIHNGQESEEKEEVDEEEEATEEENQEEVLDDDLQLGLDLMSRVGPEQLREHYDSKKEYAILPMADKALLAYLFFVEFEYEYSFVFTTKKIEYKVTTEKNSKVDNRQKLLDVYESSRGIEDHMKRYLETYEEMKKIKDSPGSNYIDASKKITQIEQKRVQGSRNIRTSILEFSEAARNALKRINEDIHGKQNIVGNPDAPMVFDSIESKKHLNRAPIRQCIREAYAYSFALSERLVRGELYGGAVEMTADELEKAFQIKVATKVAPEARIEGGNMEKLLGNADQLSSLDLD